MSTVSQALASQEGILPPEIRHPHNPRELQIIAVQEKKVRTCRCARAAFLTMAFAGTLTIGGGIWMATDNTVPLALPIILILIGNVGLGIGLHGCQRTYQHAREAELALVEIKRRVEPPKPLEGYEGELNSQPSLV